MEEIIRCNICKDEKTLTYDKDGTVISETKCRHEKAQAPKKIDDMLKALGDKLIIVKIGE